MLTKVLALEWSARGITVNAVAPTFIYTPGTAERLDQPAYLQGVLDRLPIGKVGSTTDVAGAVKAAKGGAVEFRVEKAGIVHAGVGKASFKEDQLLQNVKAFIDAVSKAKPSGSKGTYIKRVSVSSTMGPGLKIDVASLFAD